MKKEKTGKYQVYRTKRGIANTKEVIYKAESKDKIKEYLKNFKKEEGFDYYCQEEVIYSGTLHDSDHKPIEQPPTWINMDCMQ